jgi:hypothetical protein
VRRIASLAGFWLSSLLSVGAAQPATAQVSWDRYRIGAVAVDKPPTLDGVSDDSVWRSAALIDEFIQQEPNAGARSSERTEVLLLSDAETVYVCASRGAVDYVVGPTERARRPANGTRSAIARTTT